MRTKLLIGLLLAATFCGCKTTHIALTHPGLGVHVVAKFEANDDQPAVLPVAGQFAGHPFVAAPPVYSPYGSSPLPAYHVAARPLPPSEFGGGSFPVEPFVNHHLNGTELWRR